MTIYQELHKRLVDSGLFEDMATEVMDRVKAIDYIRETMGNRWDDSADDYPPILLTSIWITVKGQTLHLSNKEKTQ